MRPTFRLGCDRRDKIALQPIEKFGSERGLVPRGGILQVIKINGLQKGGTPNLPVSSLRFPGKVSHRFHILAAENF